MWGLSTQDTRPGLCQGSGLCAPSIRHSGAPHPCTWACREHYSCVDCLSLCPEPPWLLGTLPPAKHTASGRRGQQWGTGTRSHSHLVLGISCFQPWGPSPRRETDGQSGLPAAQTAPTSSSFMWTTRQCLRCPRIPSAVMSSLLKQSVPSAGPVLQDTQAKRLMPWLEDMSTAHAQSFPEGPGSPRWWKIVQCKTNVSYRPFSKNLYSELGFNISLHGSVQSPQRI